MGVGGSPATWYVLYGESIFRSLRPSARLSLDDRGQLHDVVDRRFSIDRGLPQDLAGAVLEMIEERIDDLGRGGRGLEEIGIREEKPLERGLRREAGENRVLPLTDDRGLQELVSRDRREHLGHRRGDLVQTPALDDAKDGLLAGAFSKTRASSRGVSAGEIVYVPDWSRFSRPVS